MATFTNQATLSYSGGSTNSNIITGEIVEVLTISKTAVTDTYSAPDKITYVVSLVNSGSTALTGLTVTDGLGSFALGETATEVHPLTYVPNSVRYYNDGVLMTAPTVTSAAGLLAISGITVPANGNSTIVYEVTTNEYTPLGVGDSVINTVSVSGGGLANAVTATETITPNARPALAITKSVSPNTVAENGQLTYTFTIENYGNTEATATDAVSITDVFNPVLKSIAVSYNGAAWTSPADYTYDTTSGTFTSVAGKITVPAATFTTNATTGVVTTTPGTAVVTITGTI